MEQLRLGRYQHYKGEYYEVIGVGRHSETLEKLVVYKALYNSKDFGKDALWVRPLSMFNETIELKGEQIPRFKFINEN